jgi:hypothetical protein
VSLRLRRSTQKPTRRWESAAIAPCSGTKLGFSFRVPQAEEMGLDQRVALNDLLRLDFDVVRLAALWDRLEPRPGQFDWSPLDWQVEAAAKAGLEVIFAVGPIKNFGYPEFYVPRHRLPEPLPDGRLITVESHPDLSAAAATFLESLIQRYRGVTAITMWQVEHEAVDPLGLEHSWRLSSSFVARQVELVRQLDPARPILLNGFVPMSRPVELQQLWRTRDQGDSLAVGQGLADVVGLDVYPCHAVLGGGGFSLYLDAAPLATRRSVVHAISAARDAGRRVMVSEGQAEPWEAITRPPNPTGVATSCPPERLITTYSLCQAAARAAGVELDAYLFWGAEYWLLRRASGDPAYLAAVERVLESANTLGSRS